MDILQITEQFKEDTSIDEYEYNEYMPITGSNLNNPGQNISITIQNQDLYLHPSDSYLMFEGQITKEDGSLYTNDDVITLTNNGLMHLFNCIKYRLNGQEIESISDPGQTTTMLGLLKFPDDFSKSQGLNQLWYKDTTATANLNQNNGFAVRHSYVIKGPNPKGFFSFMVPLSDIFGFCEDYDKVIYGFTHTLILTRKGNNDAIYKAAATDAGKVRLDKISWFIPHVLPSDLNKLNLYKIIEQKTKLPVGYRMRECDSYAVPQTTSFTWRLGVKSFPEVPRFIIISFQTGKDNNQDENPSIFNHVHLTNIYAMLNQKRYPAVDYSLNFSQHQFSKLYRDAASFRQKFYHMEKLVSNPNITPSDFKALYPVYVIDVSKQAERMKQTTTDIQIKAHFTENVPANTMAYAMIISDRILYFQSDGEKFSVVQ